MQVGIWQNKLVALSLLVPLCMYPRRLQNEKRDVLSRQHKIEAELRGVVEDMQKLERAIKEVKAQASRNGCRSVAAGYTVNIAANDSPYPLDWYDWIYNKPPHEVCCHWAISCNRLAAGICPLRQLYCKTFSLMLIWPWPLAHPPLHNDSNSSLRGHEDAPIPWIEIVNSSRRYVVWAARREVASQNPTPHIMAPQPLVFMDEGCSSLKGTSEGPGGRGTLRAYRLLLLTSAACTHCWCKVGLGMYTARLKTIDAWSVHM